MNKSGLSSFGLSHPFQADTAAGPQFEPDFDQLDAAELVEQLPGAQRRRAGFEFVFETDPQTVPQKGDHEMGFDSFGGEVPDWTDGKVAFESPENGFDFGELDVLGPKFGRIAPLQIGA